MVGKGKGRKQKKHKHWSEKMTLNADRLLIMLSIAENSHNLLCLFNNVLYAPCYCYWAHV